jgi:hypothetical protein
MTGTQTSASQRIAMIGGGPYGARFAADVAVTLGGVVVALTLAAATLRRRTP